MDYKRVSTITETNREEVAALQQRYELSMFMDRIASAMGRHIKFGARDNRSVWVYQPHEVFALGWIAFGDYRMSGEQGESFVVHSRHIENNKYSANSSEGYHMKMSKNMDVAVRNAKKFLRPYVVNELATIVFRTLNGAFDDARRELTTPLRELREKVFGRYTDTSMGDPHHREIFHLVEMGHQFLDAEFNRDIYALAKMRTEVSEGTNKPDHYFVYVHERFGKQLIDTVSVSGKITYRCDASDPKMYIESEAPEDLLGKVAVLNIMEQERYVMGVGVNCGDGMFYVAQ